MPTMQEIESALPLLANPETPLDQVEEVLSMVRWLKEKTKAIDEMRKTYLMERIQETGAFTDSQGVVYSLKAPDKKKGRANDVVMPIMLKAVGGDLEALANCLCSDSWKPGECGTVIEEFNSTAPAEEQIKLEDVFEIQVLKKQLLEEIGRELTEIDTRWIRRKRVDAVVLQVPQSA